jgi:hypothetical protein
MADRLDHERTAAERHYCCDRNIVTSVLNEGKKTDEPGNAFVELMSCNRERTGFKIHPTQGALRQVRSSRKPDIWYRSVIRKSVNEK